MEGTSHTITTTVDPVSTGSTTYSAPVGSIIRNDGLYYYVSHYDTDEPVQKIDGALMRAAGYYILPVTEEKYMYIQTVIPYKGKYYFIPSSVSFPPGTLCVDEKVEIIRKQYPKPQTLDKKTCMKICPGWLDV